MMAATTVFFNILWNYQLCAHSMYKYVMCTRLKMLVFLYYKGLSQQTFFLAIFHHLLGSGP